MAQRIAIVTGSARGIGAGTAKRLAADGLAVAVLDLNEADGDRGYDQRPAMPASNVKQGT